MGEFYVKKDKSIRAAGAAAPSFFSSGLPELAVPALVVRLNKPLVGATGIVVEAPTSGFA
jgi:hypothetical protein